MIPPSIRQGAFTFDTRLCTGCGACAIACTIENRLPDLPEMAQAAEPAEWQWRNIYTHNPAHLPGLPTFSLSLACNHCQEPACLAACPAAAYSKDRITGAVTINPEACLGCGYCAWACPYAAPRLHPARKVMEKCTFCNQRLRLGIEPACTSACPTGALDYTPLAAAPAGLSQAHPGFPRSALKPAIRFSQPAAFPDAAGGAERTFLPLQSVAQSGVDLRREWPLWVFTTLLPPAFALLSVSPVSSHKHPFTTPMALGLYIGGFAMLLSLLHLGHPLRAWRALLNWRTSWLSREILFVSAFLALAGAIFVLPRIGPASDFYWRYEAQVQLSLLGLGLLALFAIDRVYAVGRFAHSPPEETYRPRARLHSALALLNGLYLAGIAAIASQRAGGHLLPGETFWLWGVQVHLAAILAWAGLAASVLQLLLYVARHTTAAPSFPASGRVTKPLVSFGGWGDEKGAALPSFRVLLGFGLPWLLLASGGSLLWAFAFAFLGSALDRLEFYLDLRFVRPGWYTPHT